MIHRTKLLPKLGDKLVELFENFKDMAIEETPDGPTFIHLEKAIVVNDSSGNLRAPSYWRLKKMLCGAKKLGHSVENLKTMRAPNTINPFAKYRIDTSKLEFIKLPEPRKRMQNS